MRATKRISDPRPIYDEDYLDISKGKFSSFLKKRGCTINSLDSFGSYSFKSAIAVFHFLLNQLDQNLKFGQKADEDLPLILKSLNYPVIIPKDTFFPFVDKSISPFQTVISSWVVELCDYLSLCQSRDKEFDGEFNISSIELYETFLSGDESSGFTSEICNRIGSNYSMKFASTRKNVEQILQDNQKLRSHLSSLVPQSKLLHSSKKSLESTKTTLSNKILANAEKLSYIGTLRIRSERACKATKIKLSTRASENFTRINVHVERTDQELKMIEVQKLINAYHGKESELSVEIEEMHDKRNIDLTIDDQISRYNILLLKVPRCNVAANIKFQRPLTRNLKDLSVSTKIRAESGLSNMLLLLHETLKNISYSIRGLENEALTTQENYKMLKESISQKKETVYSIQHNIRSKEQQCENERLRVEQVVDSITNTAKNSENEIVSLRKLLSKDLSVSEKQVKSLQVLYMDLKLSCSSEKTKVQHQILTALDNIMSHKQSIQNRLAQ